MRRIILDPAQVARELQSSLDGPAWTAGGTRRQINRVTSVGDREGADETTVRQKPKTLPASEGEKSELRGVVRNLFPTAEPSLPSVPSASSPVLPDQLDEEDSFVPWLESTPSVYNPSLAVQSRVYPETEESFFGDFLPNIPAGVAQGVGYLAAAGTRATVALATSVASSSALASSALLSRAVEYVHSEDSILNQNSEGNEDETVLAPLSPIICDSAEDYGIDYPSSIFPQVGRAGGVNLSVINPGEITIPPTDSIDTATPFDPLPLRIPRLNIQAVMAATFPREIKIKELDTFDGSPSDLESFDGAVKQLLILQNLPLYYGGYVVASPDEEYEFVVPGTANAKSNYILGKRLCAGITTKFKGNAKKWWEDYDSISTNAIPNCWKKHASMKRPLDNGNGTIAEVSLYDLLKKQFSGEIDARQAEIELGKFKWDPFKKDKDVLSVVAYRTTVERLLKRTQKTSTFDRIRCIRNTLPDSIKSKTEMFDTEEDLWKRINMVHITMEVDGIDKKEQITCANCGKTGHSQDVCRLKKSSDQHGQRTDKQQSPTKAENGEKCSRCGHIGHALDSCYSRRHRNGKLLPEQTRKDTPVKASTTATATSYTRVDNKTSGTTQDPAKVKFCYRCGKVDHLARDCTTVATPSVATNQLSAEKISGQLAHYTLPIVEYSRSRQDTVLSLSQKFMSESIDERTMVGPRDDPISLPMFHLLSQSYVENEVFSVPKAPAEVQKAAGCLWSLSGTANGQQLLTVWDTGAVVCVAPMSTIRQTKTKWENKSDVGFVMADGVHSKPIGTAERFVFRIKDKHFAVKVYIVESANYQLLLGTQFIVATGCALFPRWGKVILTIPVRISVTASCERITVGAGAPPLMPEEVVEDENFEILPLNNCGVLPLFITQDVAVQIGMRDLLEEVDAVGDSGEINIPREELEKALKLGLPILTVGFVKDNLKFGPEVPEEIQRLVCGDVIEYADVFSWNTFDLGCIKDVPHKIIRHDKTPAVQHSRKHLLNPINANIIRTKNWPLVELQIFRKAPVDCIDRAQLTIVRKGVTAEQRNDPAYCRTAHDFREINSRCYTDPEPVDTIADMMSWMSNENGGTGLFFKMDADRGFNQIVMADRESVLCTGFEMMNELWVSTRMLFGLKNGPATFKRNATVMQGELLRQGRTKSYFDEIFGKTGIGEYRKLRELWVDLLKAMRSHGWKCKLRKAAWGFERIESVGFVWSKEGVGMADKSVNAIKAMRLPRSVSELRGVLGLANQFRERVPGYALMVANLTALTRGTNSGKKFTLNPESMVEFENIKAALISPAILRQFDYAKKTIVYTDASAGTQDGLVSGGLRVVIVQIDHDDIEYVCCFASSGLSSAQRNYHIVRLELLALVYACGKFHEWLSCVPFVWRTDCRAHQFLSEAKTSTNQTIARYALTLAEYDFRIEWIPGVKMLADPLSRLVILPAGQQDAMTLPEIVFGSRFGSHIYAEKYGGRKPNQPVLYYVPSYSLTLCENMMAEIECDDGMRCENLIRHCAVPMSKIYADSPHADDEQSSDEAIGEADITTTPVEEVCMFEVEIHSNKGEVDVPEDEAYVKYGGPVLTRSENMKLEAVRWVRRFRADEKDVPKDANLAKCVRKLAAKTFIEGDKLFIYGSNGSRLEVLDSLQKIKEVLNLLHDGMGHRATGSCYQIFQTRFWLPGAWKIIERHIQSCVVCQEFTKPNPLAAPGYKVQPSDVFTHWSIDFAGPFPADSESGCRYVCIAVEWVTRWAEAAATREATPEVAADFIYEYIVTRYGCPLSLQSDNGTHFVNPIIKNLCRILRVKHRLSTPYYPQSNGKVERVVGTIKTMLKRAVLQHVEDNKTQDESGNVFGIGVVVDQDVIEVVRKDVQSEVVIEEPEPMEKKTMYWAPLLQTVLWAYRCTPHAVTGSSPAMMTLGAEPRLPIDVGDKGSLENLIPITDEEHKKMISNRLSWMCDVIPGMRQIKEEKNVVKEHISFALGQKVWLRESKFDEKGFAPVFAPRWSGPFVIHSVWDKNVYKLRTDPSVTGKKVGYIKNPVNGHRLKPYVEGELVS